MILLIALLLVIIGIGAVVLSSKRDYSGFSNTTQSKIAAGLLSDKYVSEIRAAIASNAAQRTYKEKEKAN